MEKIIIISNYLKNIKGMVHIELVNKKVSSKLDNNIYFSLGYLIMYLYIAQIRNCSRDCIKYINKTIYITNKKECKNGLIDSATSEKIINNLIEKSVYNIEFLPEEVISISREEVFEIINGFREAYNLVIKEKCNLIDYIYSIDKDKEYVELINFIKLLNPRDLEMQIKFIMLKHNFNKKKKKSFDYNNFKKIDNCISSGVIGVSDIGLELMWIEYYRGELQPTKYRNIYIAILFAYISKKTNNSYYLKSAQYTVNPIITYLKENRELENINEYELISSMYLLNEYIEYEVLDNFIKENSHKFNNFNLKSNEDNNDKKEYIIKKSIEVLGGIII